MQAEEIDGINYSLNSSEKMAEVLSISNKYSEDIVIPETVEYNGVTYNVTSIGNSAFSGCSSLTSIDLPDGLTSIGDYAFYSCSSLTSIDLPNGITSIGLGAFNNCSSLTSIALPDGLTSIGYNVFLDCSSLTEIKVAPDNPVYDSRDNCNAVIETKSNTLIAGCASTIIPSSVTSIGNYAFQGCSSLTSIDLPNGLTSIGKGAFYACSSLTSIALPDGLTSTGQMAFAGCSSLTSIDLPDGLTSIEYRAFESCSSLTCIDLSDGITSIGERAFYKCSSLTSIDLPDGITSIGYAAFYNCSSLTSIDLPDGLTSIGDWTFGSCSSLTSIDLPDGLTDLGHQAFQDCSSLTSIVLPDGVTSIGYNTFCNCSSLTSIDLPEGLTSIGDNAFYNCPSLTSIDLPDGITSIGGRVFCDCSSLTSIDLPDGITSIGIGAFDDCSSLTSIDLPNGLTSIGYAAFYNCSSLTSIDLPDGVTSIGEWAFYNCSSLTSIALPDGLTGIGNNAFSGCSSLTSIALPDGLTSIEPGAFDDCSSLTSIDLPDGLTSIGGWAFSSCSSLTSIDLPDGLTSIGDYAFQDCSSLDRIYLQGEKPFTYNPGSNLLEDGRVIIVPESAIDTYCKAEGWSDYAKYITGAERMSQSIEVTASNSGSSVRSAIGDDLVAGVVDLKIKGTINSYDIIVLNQKMPILHNLDLSEAQIVACDYPYYNSYCTADNQLSDYLFYAHPSLHHIILPNETTGMGSRVLSNCTNLKSVVLPNGLNSIGDYAFAETSIKSIVIPNGVTTIDANAFSYSGLQEIILPESLVEIGGSAFEGTNLNKVVLPPNLKTIGGSTFSSTPLTEIRLPSSLREIGGSAFSGCNNLKKVYTYTILPLSIADGTFSNTANAELYLPEISSENYHFAAGWNGFLNHITFNEPYEYFYLAGDKVLNDNTGYIEGEGDKNPDADINPGGGFIVEGEQGDNETPNQSLGDVNLENDGNGNSGSIMGDNNLWLDNLNIKINVKGGRWYFFAFPFDIKMDKISLENGSAHVWRYYDGEERANGNTGWKNVNVNKLNATQGYIFQSNGDDVLVLNIGGLRVKREDKYNELVAHLSDNLKDASWNFMGNPYMSYYDLNDMDYSAPVTVWDGTKYVAIRPGDDDYHFTPFEAFFVQKPEGEGSVGFDGDQQMTQTQSKEKKETQKAARKMLVKQMAGSDNPRKLINLTLNSGEDNDGTRIVFNNAQSMAYETMCDAAKFESQGVIQLFTLGTGNERYAINERPVDNGIVSVGYTVPTAGEYTISASRMDTPVFVKDMKTGALHDLREGGYTFSTEAGTLAQRIQIWTEGTATGIGRVNAGQAEGAEKVYDMSGRATNKEAKGVYIINGNKTLMK